MMRVVKRGIEEQGRKGGVGEERWKSGKGVDEI